MKKQKQEFFLFFLIPIFIILLSFHLVVFNSYVYKTIFKKADVYQNLGKEIADGESKNIINFLLNKSELSNFFNQKEKSHMTNVRELIYKLLNIFYIIALLIIPMVLSLGFLPFNTIRKSLFLTIILIVLLGLILISNFNMAFSGFHKIFFKEDSYIFSPQENLIKLFSNSFFIYITEYIFILSFIFSAAFLLVIHLLIILKKQLNL